MLVELATTLFVVFACTELQHSQQHNGRTASTAHASSIAAVLLSSADPRIVRIRYASLAILSLHALSLVGLGSYFVVPLAVLRSAVKSDAVARVLFVFGGFAILVEVERRRGAKLADIVDALLYAFPRAMLIFVPVAIGIAVFYLALDAVMEAVLVPMGVSTSAVHELLNWPIYYGVLYGPFASVYVFVRTRLRVVASSPVLPP